MESIPAGRLQAALNATVDEAFSCPLSKNLVVASPASFDVRVGNAIAIAINLAGFLRQRWGLANFFLSFFFRNFPSILAGNRFRPSRKRVCLGICVWAFSFDRGFDLYSLFTFEGACRCVVLGDILYGQFERRFDFFFSGDDVTNGEIQ